MPMLVTADGGGGGRRTDGKVWLGWDPNHPSQEKLEPLVSSISVPSAPMLGPLPAVGWRCGPDDAAQAVAAGSRLLYAGGDAAVESAIGAAVAGLDDDARRAVRIITSLHDTSCDSGESARAACEAAVDRLGGLHIDILVSCAHCAKDCAVYSTHKLSLSRALNAFHCGAQLLSETSWSVAAGLLESGACRAVGLSVSSAALSVPALQTVLLAGGAQPSVLVTVLHPLVPLVQRMLLGLCRRKGVRVFALEPLGGEMAEGVQAAAAAATERAAAVLGMTSADSDGPAVSQEWESEATSVLLGGLLSLRLCLCPNLGSCLCL